MLSALLFFSIFNFALNLVSVGLWVFGYWLKTRDDRLDKYVEEESGVDYSDETEDNEFDPDNID